MPLATDGSTTKAEPRKVYPEINVIVILMHLIFTLLEISLQIFGNLGDLWGFLGIFSFHKDLVLQIINIHTNSISDFLFQFFCTTLYVQKNCVW